MSKVFSTEGLRAAAADVVALAAPESLLWRNDDLHYGEVAMRRALGMTIYGGTSGIQRSLIAEQLLKMPKSRTCCRPPHPKRLGRCSAGQSRRSSPAR